MPNLHRLYLLLALLGGILTGCKNLAPQRSVVDYSLSTPFIPPIIPTNPAQLNNPAIEPTPTRQCENNLSFISDLTIPDGSQVPANAIIDKRWEVINSGTCDWDDRYHLRLIAGSLLGANASEQPLFPARSGGRAVLRIFFQAPSEEGRYRSAWQAFDPNDLPFGDPIFIDIEVVSAPPTP
jgi:hypothetical protein